MGAEISGYVVDLEGEESFGSAVTAFVGTPSIQVKAAGFFSGPLRESKIWWVCNGLTLVVREQLSSLFDGSL